MKKVIKYRLEYYSYRLSNIFKRVSMAITKLFACNPSRITVLVTTSTGVKFEGVVSYAGILGKDNLAEIAYYLEKKTGYTINKFKVIGILA